MSATAVSESPPCSPLLACPPSRLPRSSPPLPLTLQTRRAAQWRTLSGSRSPSPAFPYAAQSGSAFPQQIIIMILLGLAITFITLLLIYSAYAPKRYPLTPAHTILITGACMGLGRQLALLCAKRRCKLILLDIRDDLSSDLLSALKAAGAPEAHFYKCDIADLAQCASIVSQVKAKHQVNVLFNNAGICIPKFFKDETMRDVNRTNTINFLGPVLFTKAFIQEECFEHVVNIGSAASVVQGMKIAAYSASKHELWGYHQCLRLELKLKKSLKRTTLIASWGINTGLIRGLKTKLDFIFPIMTDVYVAAAVIDATERGKEIAFIPWYQNYVSHFSRLLPTHVVDRLILFVQAEHVHQFVGNQI